MSITIGTTDYYTYSRLQSLQSGKDDKDSTAETGKTQESSVSASLDRVNLGKDGTAVNEVSRQQGTEQTGSQKKPTLTSRMDTVEISAEGRAASARLQAQQSGESAGEYEYEEDDLSDYTDTELRQMYYKGEITRQEYEDETGETLE